MKRDVEAWAREARELVKLENDYPFYVIKDIELDGEPVGGYCHPTPLWTELILGDGWRTKKGFLALYLHEVAHAVAFHTSLHFAPHGEAHNKYFATILGVMYRRAGLFDRLKLYDFADGLNYVNGKPSPDSSEEMVDGRELVLRLAYIVSTSAKLARSNLSIEAAANWLYENDYFNEEMGIVRKKKIPVRVGLFGAKRKTETL